MAGNDDTFKLVAKNLFTLEVNTILKANILGTRMPPPVHALLDIAREYHQKLCESEEEPGPLPETATLETFVKLRERAHDAIQSYSADIAQARLQGKSEEDLDALDRKLLMLNRIKDNSDQIKSIFQGLAKREAQLSDEVRRVRGGERTRDATLKGAEDLSLTPNEMLTLRKIWEIGLEEIVLQTVVQLDGDVTTRIQPRFLRQDEAQRRLLLDIHQESLQTSLGIWKSLAEMLGTFVKTVGQILFGR